MPRQLRRGRSLLRPWWPLVSICLLRTGEILALQFQDFEFNKDCGVVTLRSSKSGLRTGTEEAVSIRDSLVLNLLQTLWDTELRFRGQKLWPHSGQHFRTTLDRYLQFFGLLISSSSSSPTHYVGAELRSCFSRAFL